ncbi:MAG: SGNH/GDSL hydrolase family protein [Sphingobacteriales bacterium]|nr:MAG: SGNH/GDSL hydrolase family protein [Sphingobacteriales bacterium]
MRQPNPAYNKVDEAEVEVMMNDERTDTFALGLYFDVIVDKTLQPTYVLKSFVQRSHKEKGFLGDTVLNLANWWARRKRNRLYEEVKESYPDRIRIVSEGDSWFQHPLVNDIIDHLHRTYAVYCVAAAGDTLRNMQGVGSKQGEYYLDAIEREKPAFFLISAGGNDILGAQFRNYLNDTFDEAGEGEKAKRFLRDAIFKEMDSLADIYRQLFRHLKETHPELQVIVHGYDYPVKLDDDKKGWLGRYMIEKGIKRPGDRKAIIQLIMDDFNRRLKEVATEFDTVIYIDLRGTVRYNPDEKVDQWYDEIHPNNDGFQQVAMKFMERISGKVAQKTASASETVGE